MNIAFWNIKKNNEIYDTIVEFIQEYEIDVLLIAECPFGFFIDLKKHPSFSKFEQISNGDSKVEIYSRIPKSHFSTILEAKRWTGYQINIPNKIKINLISVHFPSKVNWSENSLALECVNLSNDVKKIETKTKNQNSIIIGDFNMNPFEAGLLSANGLNAIQDLEYSKKTKSRIVNNIKYDFFYNPMWNFFGDFNKPYGTHFNRNSDNISYEWNIFDQIIIRPNISELINSSSIQIINQIKNVHLGSYFDRPNKKYSDYYPILLNLSI